MILRLNRKSDHDARHFHSQHWHLHIPQAARLIGVPDARLRSWMTGTTIRTKGGFKHQPALWQPHLPELEGRQALTFLDLMEIRLVKRLLDQEKRDAPDAHS